MIKHYFDVQVIVITYTPISVRKEGKTIRGLSEPPKSLLYTCEYLIVNDETKNGLSW